LGRNVAGCGERAPRSRAALAAAECHEIMNTSALVDRPLFWLLPVLEWSILFTTLLWVLVVALTVST
jgi:hypothetical protein